MAETEKDAEKSAEKTVSDDDPRLAGHALQDHEHLKTVLDPDPPSNPEDKHRGNPVRSNPDLVQGTRDEALEEVRRVHAANAARAATHGRTVVETAVTASTTGGNPKSIEITTADGRCFVNSHGEAVLDQDGVADLIRKLQMAFQAVS